METPVIEMDRTKAKQAWHTYCKAVKERQTRDDKILKAGYRHLSQGKKILDLVEVMKFAGVDSQGRPKLAIARASWEQCFLRSDANGDCSFLKRSYVSGAESRGVIYLPPQTLSPLCNSWSQYSALVPSIPPQYKPAGRLDDYFILWDATWTSEPPTDPILLRHLGRYIYAVLAMWNLSALERALLR
jgi:hypothetical protein